MGTHPIFESDFDCLTGGCTVGMLLWLSVLLTASGQDLKKRFEYEHSFKGPYIAQTDGQVPFWSYHDHAIAGDENVRLVPSLRSRQGSIWTKKVFDKDWWEVEVHIRISGRGKIGADGMAIWYTVEGAPGEGTDRRIYGSRDRWMGLGIVLDSFDNNNQQDNPVIMAFANDGTKEYNHAQDGGGEELFACRRDFRNKPYPIRLKITYYKNILTIYYHAGVTEFDDYELCGRAENVVLEKGYFGLSAATGGLSDDHDVLKFLTHSISDPDAVDDAIVEDEASRNIQEEREKQYEEQRLKYEEEKKKFEEENPERVMPDAGGLMGGDVDPQLQAIFTVQNHIQENIKAIAASIEQTKSMIDLLPVKLQPGLLATAVPQPAAAAETDKRNEITKTDILQVLQKQNTFSVELNKVNNQMADISAKIMNIQATVASKNGAPGEAQMNQIEEKQNRELSRAQMNDIRSDLQLVRRTVEFLNIKDNCPTPPEVNCVTSMTFVFLTILQVGLIGFIVHYKMSQEAAAKKFF